MKIFKILLIVFLVTGSISAQNEATIRGFIYSNENGEPVLFTNVFLKENQQGASTDVNGFFTIPKVKPGTYTLTVSNVEFEKYEDTITLKANEIRNIEIFLNTGQTLDMVEVSAEQQEKTTRVQMSMVKATKKEISAVPSTGGEPDIATYFQTVPGVVTSGDQGGQFYVRGGTPIQNKILMDGMTIYNPFHSIGFFSVFDTDIISNADIYTGGFNAYYGGRVSSIMDISTRDGNKKKVSGKVGASPFLGKLMVEGPLIKRTEENPTSGSFILSGKGSILEQTSRVVYPYVNDGNGMPFNFLDLYGKTSFSGKSGNKFNLFGFSHNDAVQFQETSKYNWNSFGLGSNFVLAPSSSPLYLRGKVNYSNYKIGLEETGLAPRTSDIWGFNMGFDFTYFLKEESQVDYGIDLNVFQTSFNTFNSVGREVGEESNTTEIGAYVSYRWIKGIFVMEPSFRLQYYASLATAYPEPRLRFKVNATKRLRFKGAVGMFSQNFTSTESDRDVVNLFYGFLSAPTNTQSTFTQLNGQEVDVRNGLQKSNHFILGGEYDITENFSVNLEGYYKMFPQLTNLNRNKIYQDNLENAQEPDILKKDFIIESGYAVGGDIVLKYSGRKLYVWTVYSLSKVIRWDGFQEYFPVFDRRHNANIIVSYHFGNNWEVNGRWNFGSGFPFTQTVGYYENENFQGGIATDYTQTNADDVQFILGELNTGRLPTYHRFDISGKKTFEFKNDTKLEIIGSVTNLYDRDNIFYINRLTNDRVDQLPILPSIGFNFLF